MRGDLKEEARLTSGLEDDLIADVLDVPGLVRGGRESLTLLSEGEAGRVRSRPLHDCGVPVSSVLPQVLAPERGRQMNRQRDGITRSSRR